MTIPPKSLASGILIVALCFLTAPSAKARAPSSVLVNRVKQAVVLLTTYDAAGQPLLQGSAFFIAANRIVTSLHLLRGACTVRIQTFDKQTYPVQGIAAVNESCDLALLETAFPSSAIAPLDIAEAMPQEGANVIVVSNPERCWWKVTQGKTLASWDFQGIGELLRITARLAPGSSGGPVVNQQGQVVGVATMHTSSGDELNFAVPAKLIQTLHPQALMPLPYVRR